MGVQHYKITESITHFAFMLPACGRIWSYSQIRRADWRRSRSSTSFFGRFIGYGLSGSDPGHRDADL